MDVAVLQLASFVADLEDFFDHEKIILDEALQRSRESGSFEEGLLVGANALHNVSEIEKSIERALDRLQRALRPIGFDRDIRNMRERELFRYWHDNSFAESLEEAAAVLLWRQLELREIREHLLDLAAKGDCEAYSDSIREEFEERWEQDLCNLLRGNSL